jgi:MFS family permease
VLLVGVMSLFADFTYEGSRSIVGQYLGTLGAGALAVAVVSGFGELLGYGLRLVSGRAADRTGRYWPITIGGYVLQMSVVPLLALAGSWPLAAALVILERVGKATRNPPRDAMLSHAAGEMGYGWGFGVHEALDQLGAVFGPLLVALILAVGHHDYRLAFASLAIPALIMLSLLGVARMLYPRPQDLEAGPGRVSGEGLPRVFWVYLAGAALVGAGFADFPLIAFHFQSARTVSTTEIPLLYAAAMAVDGVGALLFGRLFDRAGIGILVPLTIVGALFAPLVFLGARDGRARVDRARRRGADGAGQPTGLRLRDLHRGLRGGVVPGERCDGGPVRLLAGRRGGVLGGGRARRDPLHPARPTPPDEVEPVTPLVRPAPHAPACA